MEKLGVIPDGTSDDFHGLLIFVLGKQETKEKTSICKSTIKGIYEVEVRVSDIESGSILSCNTRRDSE